MPPLVLVDDEVFEYPIGEPPAEGEPDDRTTLLWSRLDEQELRDLRETLTVRGQILDVWFRDAVIATALRGWRHLIGRTAAGQPRGEVPWPPPPAPAGFRPRGLPDELAREDWPPQLAGLLDTMAVLTSFPLRRDAEGNTVLDRFYLEIMRDNPDTLLKNWPAQSSEKSALPATASATPASIADASVPSPAMPSPVIPGA